MFDFSQASIQSLAIHKAGSSAAGGSIVLAQSLIQISDEDVLNLLKTYFLTPFKQPEFFSFAHETDIEMNEVYNYAQRVFGDTDLLLEQSQNIAKHLFNSSNHPNIKEGELYVAWLKDCIIDGELVDALGIFKSENKDTFLKVFQQSGSFELEQHKGINIRKLDKGCLIFNTEQDFGYKVVAIDNTNKNDEARYWKDTFLGIKPREDDFYQTSGYINLCKDFVKDVLVNDTAVDKEEQVAILSKTRDYFIKSDTFNQDEFEENIISKPEIVEQFREYKDAYQTEMGCNLKDTFTISVDAAKQAKKVFKSIIKLDKNFHLYIHGGRDRVEKGFDHEKGLGFYKLYFDAEA